MAEDWKPGDVAICANDKGAEEVIKGSRYTVMETHFGINQDGTEGVGLELLEVKPSPRFECFDARRFKKEPPLIKETEIEREKELMK